MGGSGGGGGSYRSVSPSSARRLEAAREKERERLRGEINGHLRDLLVKINDRDVDTINKHLQDVKDCLSDRVEIDSILLGGSVAKHTDVTGLSDVDALVILDRDVHRDHSPSQVISEFRRTLETKLPRSEIESITGGKLAVTVRFKDDTELQLLPALKTRSTISIPATNGTKWNATKPREFTQKLTAANQKLNGSLVPAIKLLKSINAGFPDQKRMSGYHIETMAVEAAKNYNGPNTYRDVLLGVIDHARSQVLQPMKDSTLQSRVVDGYLGKKDAVARRNISQTLRGLHRRLSTATNLGQWKSEFDD